MLFSCMNRRPDRSELSKCNVDRSPGIEKQIESRNIRDVLYVNVFPGIQTHSSPMPPHAIFQENL